VFSLRFVGLSVRMHTTTEGVVDEYILTQFLANVNSRSRSLYAIARPSVVCLSSVTFVRPTQAVQISGNISTALGTLVIR